MNIMLNQVCNLTCPYCFANEFVGRSEESLLNDKSQISLSNFNIALDFAIKSREPRIGLIGGEPLLHPKFEEIVAMAINSPMPKVHLFTNGILLDKYFNLFGSDKFTILINVNSPEDIGQEKYDRLLDNIEYLINKMYAKEKMSIGINIYKEGMDYTFITDLIKKYSFKRLRLAITTPNTDDKRSEKSLDYFKRMKKDTFRLFQEIKELGCIGSYDCNGMPTCITSSWEKDWLKEFSKLEKEGGPTNIYENHKCSPVLDVLPDLKVVRCFGMSDVLKVDLLKFENTKQVRGYFVHEIDNIMDLIPANKECLTCVYKNSLECNGGCLAFKLKDYYKLKELIKDKYFKGELISK